MIIILVLVLVLLLVLAFAFILVLVLLLPPSNVLSVSVCLSVCLFVCLSECPLDYSKSYQRILIRFYGEVGRGLRNDPLDFGDDPNHARDPEIFLNSLFTIAIITDSRE